MNNFRIENGILKEYLGREARITVPEGVTEIDDGAFSECPSATSVTLPEGVRRIGENAFLRCRMLNRIDIPKTVTRIEDHAFCDCNALKRVRIPRETEYIGKHAFKGCDALTEIAVEENNPKYASVDGILYTADRRNLITYAIGKGDPVFTAPKGVGVIEAFAFEGCRHLTAVCFQDGLRRIEKEAFAGCVSLAEAVFPETLADIEAECFTKCTSLQTLILPPELLFSLQSQNAPSQYDDSLAVALGTCLTEYSRAALSVRDTKKLADFVAANLSTELIKSHGEENPLIYRLLTETESIAPSRAGDLLGTVKTPECRAILLHYINETRTSDNVLDKFDLQ